MKIYRLGNSMELAVTAAGHAAAHLRITLATQSHARIVMATGESQLAFLATLATLPAIDWSRVTLFHLDEYVGLPAGHPASFRRYVKERFADLVHPGRIVLIDGEADPQEECRRVGDLIAEEPLDLAFVGIGENGHLAFNDPPADFGTRDPYIVVSLDQACRTQQVHEGWFSQPSEVPALAISLSISQLMSARRIFCMVPGRRKAAAVRACLEEDVSPLRPASILRHHPNASLYLDQESSALLSCGTHV